MANPTLADNRSREPSPRVSSLMEMKKDISRSISIATQNSLWGRAASCCTFTSRMNCSGRFQSRASVRTSLLRANRGSNSKF